MKLSKREKVLLCALAVLALAAALGVFWIVPHYQALTVNRETFEKLEDRRVEAEALILRSQAAEQEIAKLQEEADSLFLLMEQTKSYDVSLLLSELLARYDLVPVSLKITPYQDVQTPELPQEEESGGRQNIYTELDEELEQYEDTGTELAVSDSEAESFALKRTATLSFTGERENANRFLDEITNYNRSVLVDGYTIENTAEVEVYEIRIDFYEFVKPTLSEDSAVSSAGEGGE